MKCCDTCPEGFSNNVQLSDCYLAWLVAPLPLERRVEDPWLRRESSGWSNWLDWLDWLDCFRSWC